MRHASRPRKAAAAALAAIGLALTVTVQACAAAPGHLVSGRSGPIVGPVSQLSRGSCADGNAEVETASDPARGYVYAEWIGCKRIGFAASANGGRTWTSELTLPGSAGRSWDPAITVGPSGAIYAAFMVYDPVGRPGHYYPVVDISGNHGTSFRVSRLGAPAAGDFGDRDFVAVGPDGRIYVTWDYAPVGSEVKVVCYKGGSCGYSNGDLNEVIQTSANGGRTWSKITPVAPGYPDSGSVSAPVIVRPSGQVDVLYERFAVSAGTLALGPGHDYFTSSADGGRTWARPVRLGPASDSVSLRTWWIDGSLAADAGGNLYATWTTQGGGRDTGWLEYSTTDGRSWSGPRQVISSPAGSADIVQVLGGASGTGYVGMLTDGSGSGSGSGSGYLQYLRAYSIGRGWQTQAVRVSPRPGRRPVWPGDTFGLALLGGRPGQRRVAVSWGGAMPRRQSEIRAAVVSALP